MTKPRKRRFSTIKTPKAYFTIRKGYNTQAVYTVFREFGIHHLVAYPMDGQEYPWKVEVVVDGHSYFMYNLKQVVDELPNLLEIEKKRVAEISEDGVN